MIIALHTRVRGRVFCIGNGGLCPLLQPLLLNLRSEAGQGAAGGVGGNAGPKRNNQASLL